MALKINPMAGYCEILRVLFYEFSFRTNERFNRSYTLYMKAGKFFYIFACI